MGFFSFTDISISGAGSDTNDVSGDLSGIQNMQTYRFPIDLGAPDKGHYMMLFINQQRNTQYPLPLDPDNSPTVIENFVKKGITSNTPQTAFNPNSNTQRTLASIALYMPDTLTFENTQSYSDFAIGQSLAGAVVSGISSFQEALRQNKGAKNIYSASARNAAVSVAAPAAAALVGSKAIGTLLGDQSLGKAIWSTVTGKVMNPMMEVIYSKPEFRHFGFEFNMYPRSQAEATQLQGIINLLKLQQLPEIDKRSKGFFLIPPATFDIKFFYNGVENINIEKISTCVLKTMSIDYAPNGFAAYEVPGTTAATLGATGMPVGIKMTLLFSEVEYMTKENYLADTSKIPNLDNAVINGQNYYDQTTTPSVETTEVVDTSTIQET